ncbi:hypothetical protein [Blastococcus xanthinilyticus]|uniref:Uncharacterized protein n=1 Tax=Blastococcus xanthinilyticus TaxID=1564164 RepID=A0A5S5CQQ9_9ACTN|nr:hypothetical protein [Blastococcus xanthinilyticus]TYP86211.1 hypothetical protein BD833_110100 [Blastococcus xanthinilyticus]
MASTILDVRDTLAPAPARTARRVPVPALAAGVLAVLEAVGLLATGLTQAGALLSPATRPAAGLLVAGVVVLAGWIVLCAGGGAALIDGAGRRLVVATSSVELLVVTLLGVLAVVAPAPSWLAAAPPLPVLFALAVALPVGKLLLADAPSARRWVLAGPRPRVQRPDPVRRHRVLCTVTLGAIALGLVAVTVLAPADEAVGTPASSVVYQP